MKALLAFAIIAPLFCSPITAQQQSQNSVPDAPSATRPSNPFPAGTRPAPKSGPDQPPADQPAAASDGPQQPAPPSDSAQQSQPPQEGEQVPTFRVGVNVVTVPVTVKDGDGHAVLGLLRSDFTVLEDGKPQNITFFTSDPYPLSAAVIIDQGMSDTAMRKVNAGLESLAAAFAPYDEVALYTYTNVVSPRADWQAVSQNVSNVLQRSRNSGRTGGVPVTSGPMAGNGPYINGRPLDPGQTHVNTVSRESHVLNDAMLRAANDLAKRDPKRRKVIFIVSDGNEDGSNASYSDVLKLLLTYNISVYALGVDSAAIPVYEKVARVRLPKFGTGNILPKYVSATGGQLITEFTREDIERAYADLAGQARNQYTLQYNSDSKTLAYRSIELLVNRPNLRVYARDGYYPLPSRSK
jgi:VWFA-related protein